MALVLPYPTMSGGFTPTGPATVDQFSPPIVHSDSTHNNPHAKLLANDAYLLAQLGASASINNIVYTSSAGPVSFAIGATGFFLNDTFTKTNANSKIFVLVSFNAHINAQTAVDVAFPNFYVAISSPVTQIDLTSVKYHHFERQSYAGAVEDNRFHHGTVSSLITYVGTGAVGTAGYIDNIVNNPWIGNTSGNGRTVYIENMQKLVVEFTV